MLRSLTFHYKSNTTVQSSILTSRIKVSRNLFKEEGHDEVEKLLKVVINTKKQTIIHSIILFLFINDYVFVCEVMIINVISMLNATLSHRNNVTIKQKTNLVYRSRKQYLPWTKAVCHWIKCDFLEREKTHQLI